MEKCKWEQDEVCVNADCPVCADFCPVEDTPGVCRFEERGKRTNGDRIRAATDEREMAGIIFGLLKESEGYTDSRSGFVMLLGQEGRQWLIT